MIVLSYILFSLCCVVIFALFNRVWHSHKIGSGIYLKLSCLYLSNQIIFIGHFVLKTNWRVFCITSNIERYCRFLMDGVMKHQKIVYFENSWNKLRLSCAKLWTWVVNTVVDKSCERSLWIQVVNKICEKKLWTKVWTIVVNKNCEKKFEPNLWKKLWSKLSKSQLNHNST